MRCFFDVPFHLRRILHIVGQIDSESYSFFFNCFRYDWKLCVGGEHGVEISYSGDCLVFRGWIIWDQMVPPKCSGFGFCFRLDYRVDKTKHAPD